MDLAISQQRGIGSRDTRRYNVIDVSSLGWVIAV
jgi:hypothetical protein